MRFGHFVIALFTVSLAVSTIAQTQNARRGASPDHLFVDPGAIKWESLPPGWADGPPPTGYSLGQSEVAIIEGDPTKEGAPFVLRIRSTPGTQVPPHWHVVQVHGVGPFRIHWVR